jgi:spore coat protein A
LYAVNIKTGTARIRSGGARTPIVGFNGMSPGPTIVAPKDKLVKVGQINSWNDASIPLLDRRVSIHNHGAKVAPESDGHPIDRINVGGSKTYTYENQMRAGTYWYHDHTMDRTGFNVYHGLAGFYIIRDPVETAPAPAGLNLPSGKYDVPLLLQDKKLNNTTENKLVFDPQPGFPGEFMGNLGLVNGALGTHFNVETRKYRFRVLNGSNARVYNLSLSSGRSFQVIGSDGGLLAAPVTKTELSVAPAERYDIVIDFNGRMDTNEFLRDTGSALQSPPGGLGNLLEFRVKKLVSDTSSVPATLSTIPRFQASEAAATRELRFRLDAGGNWVINEKTFDPGQIEFGSLLNTVYIWSLVNQSGTVHPFHKHLAHFQVLDVNGVAPSLVPAVMPELTGWKDTVAVPPGAVVRIIFKNERFTSTPSLPYVFHCHNLEHEDHRMMLQEAVCSQLPCP